MAIVVSPVAASLATHTGANAPALTPGQVIDALVLRLIDRTHVQLAIGTTILDVETAVPLAEGAHVHLAVRMTPDGTKLVLLRPGEAQEGGGSAPTPRDVRGTETTREAARAPTPTQSPVPASTPVTPSAALAQAVSRAAVVQDGLAPLFADAQAALATPGLPDPVRQGLAQLLSFRMRSDASIKGTDVVRALARSGLFLEHGLAASSEVGASSGAPTPRTDLKAALHALRGALTGALGTGTDTKSVEAEPSGFTGLAGVARPPNARPDLLGAQALYRAIGQTLADLGVSAPPSLNGGTEIPTDPVAGEAATRGVERVPPPYRGSDPIGQGVATATIDAADTPKAAAEKLLRGTEAALAHQTLLQAAAVPDPIAATSPGADAGTRLMFEVPIATPQGTTIAQFEIARDGAGPGAAAEPPSRVWRVRFSVDIEPIGLVHAQVAVTGERTAVSLWAERDTGAAELRAHADELVAGLRDAALDPTDVSVRDGAPPRAKTTETPAAGRFLDRAS